MAEKPSQENAPRLEHLRRSYPERATGSESYHWRGAFSFTASYKLSMRIKKTQIIEYAEKYDLGVKGTADELIERDLVDWFSQHRYLNRENLIKLGRWKSPRALNQYKNPVNSDERIKELTFFALTSQDEYIRIMCPQILKGVSWGVASVILHFAYPDDYSIIDFRAVWTLGWEQPKIYTFEYWMRYTDFIRNLAKETGISNRVIDKALWQYSKDNQP